MNPLASHIAYHKYGCNKTIYQTGDCTCGRDQAQAELSTMLKRQKNTEAILRHLADRWNRRCDGSNERTGFLIRGSYLKKAAAIVEQIDKEQPAPIDVTIDELAQED